MPSSSERETLPHAYKASSPGPASASQPGGWCSVTTCQTFLSPGATCQPTSQILEYTSMLGSPSPCLSSLGFLLQMPSWMRICFCCKVFSAFLQLVLIRSSVQCILGRWSSRFQPLPVCYHLTSQPSPARAAEAFSWQWKGKGIQGTKYRSPSIRTGGKLRSWDYCCAFTDKEHYSSLRFLQSHS